MLTFQDFLQEGIRSSTPQREPAARPMGATRAVTKPMGIPRERHDRERREERLRGGPHSVAQDVPGHEMLHRQYNVGPRNARFQRTGGQQGGETFTYPDGRKVREKIDFTNDHHYGVYTIV